MWRRPERPWLGEGGSASHIVRRAYCTAEPMADRLKRIIIFALVDWHKRFSYY
jgi:hypothetical protein